LKKYLTESIDLIYEAKSNFPESVDFLYREAHLYHAISIYLQDNGISPVSYLRKVINIYTEIIDKFSNSSDIGLAIFDRGVNRFYLAWNLYIFEGKNPHNILGQAISDFKTRLKIDGKNLSSFLGLINAYLFKVNFLLWNGGNIEENLKQLDNWIENANTLHPVYSLFYYFRFDLCFRKVIFHKMFRTDPSKNFKECEAIIKSYKKLFKKRGYYNDFNGRLKLLRCYLDVERYGRLSNVKNGYFEFLKNYLKRVKKGEEDLNGELFPLFLYMEKNNISYNKEVVSDLEYVISELKDCSTKSILTDRELAISLLYLAACYERTGDKKKPIKSLELADTFLKKYNYNLLEVRFLKSIIQYAEGYDVKKNREFLKNLLKENRFYRMYFGNLIRYYLKNHVVLSQ